MYVLCLKKKKKIYKLTPLALPLAKAIQARGALHGKDRQVDFVVMRTATGGYN